MGTFLGCEEVNTGFCGEIPYLNQITQVIKSGIN